MLPTSSSAGPRTPTVRREWRCCPHCWGQRRIVEYRPAANGEGRIPRVEACGTCLGVGQVIL